MPGPTDHLEGSITKKGLAEAAATQPTTGGPGRPVGTPPPTGFQSPTVDGLDWTG